MQKPDKRWVVAVALTALLSAQVRGPLAYAAEPDRNGSSVVGAFVTTSPIKRIIVLIGENRTFDHTFGTYVPTMGQSVANLLSMGIVNIDGSPGPNFTLSQQFQVNTPLPAHYFISVGPSEKTN